LLPCEADLLIYAGSARSVAGILCLGVEFFAPFDIEDHQTALILL